MLIPLRHHCMMAGKSLSKKNYVYQTNNHMLKYPCHDKNKVFILIPQ